MDYRATGQSYPVARQRRNTLSNLGINISVRTEQVKEAKQAVADLGSKLVDLNKSDVSIGGNNLPRDAELLKQVSQDLTRLSNLSRGGESSGGLLNAKQWQDASVLSKRVADNLGDWVAKSQKLREELKQITADMAGMSAAAGDPSLSAKHRQMMLDELQMLGGQKGDLEKEIGARGKGDARANFLRDRGTEYTGNIGSYGSQKDDAGRGQASALGEMKRVLGTVVALAGGASLLAMVHRSVETYKQRESTGADLGAMGLHDSGASDFLYGERTSAKMDLARSTGYGSTQMLRASANFARGRNVPLSTMTGFMGSVYGSTGMSESGITGLTAGIFATTANTKRQVDVLEGIEKLLANQAHQQGGPVSREQASFLAGMYTHNFEKSVSLQGTGIYDRLNGGISAGGKNAGEQLLLWKMAGGDKNDGSFERLNEIQGNMSEGIANPTIQKNLRSWMGKNLGSKAQRIAMLHSMFGLNSRKGGEAELAYDNLINVDAPSSAETIANAGEESWKGSYSGSKTRALALAGENTRARSGEILGPKVQQLEEGLLKIGTNFLDGIAKIHDVGSAIHEGGEFIKKSAKDLWQNSGPFGQMLVILSGIYAAVRVRGALEKGGDFLKGMSKMLGAGAEEATAKGTVLAAEQALAKGTATAAQRRVLAGTGTKLLGGVVGRGASMVLGGAASVAMDWALPDEAGGPAADWTRAKATEWQKNNPDVATQTGNGSEEQKITNGILRDILSHARARTDVPAMPTPQLATSE